MNSKFGAYLIIPFKYSEDIESLEINTKELQRYKLDTMDINENIKNMFSDNETQSIGEVYKISKETLVSHIKKDFNYSHCMVSEMNESYDFDIIDSYLYIFHTKIAFLCLGLSFSKMKTLRKICNPGYAINPAQFSVVDTNGNTNKFSIDSWLENMCNSWQLQRFYNSQSTLLLESYTYILSLTDTMYPTLENLRQVTFNLHQMHNPQTPVEDNSEADIRYVYAVKNTALNGYRWGCCVTSQTTAYAVADPTGNLDLQQEMNTQAADGLPIALLALYEKYTCLRFTELIANSNTRKIKTILNLKKTLLEFKAFGTVSPANLSRWNNVKQIYAYLIEVLEINPAVEDISAKIDILVAQQQELESLRSTRIMNLITVFGVVGIMASVQEIVQILSDGNNLMWSVTMLTTAILALCFGIAMRKK